MIGLAFAGVAAYAGASYVSMAEMPDAPWTAGALLGPLALALLALAWRSGRPLPIAGALACFGLLAASIVRGTVHVETLYVLQHVGVHLVLGAAFAASLRGPESLIARIAARVHPLTPDMRRYTRRVTQAWVAYFGGMALVSVGVWVCASWATWSALASFGTPIAVCTLFLGEYLLRYRLHPEFDRVSLRDTLRAWQRRSAATEPTP
ncbi:MAG TPA: hypothetical protein VH328_10625 [Burkholderiaceae bacterium]|nr:hypothetical protein [Burkholderiaceae bacterium]